MFFLSLFVAPFALIDWAVTKLAEKWEANTKAVDEYWECRKRESKLIEEHETVLKLLAERVGRLEAND